MSCEIFFLFTNKRRIYYVAVSQGTAWNALARKKTRLIDDKLVTVDGCRGMASTSGMLLRLCTRNDAVYVAFLLSYTMLATSIIAGCQPQQRSSTVRTRDEEIDSEEM